MTSTTVSLGLMSGTSVDGAVSAAIIETDGEYQCTRLFCTEYTYEHRSGLRPIHHITKAAELAYRRAKGVHGIANALYAAALEEYVGTTFGIRDVDGVREKVRQLAVAFFDGVDKQPTLADVIARSAEVHAAAARAALERSGVSKQQVSYIGYHGQTLYHDPFVNKVTVQVGDPRHLVERLGISVVYDFRSNDVRHGGQGAPLAPVYHRALLRSNGVPAAVVLNLGGTANITVVSSSSDEMIGFDTGPANGLIDRYVKERADRACDENSVIAQSGTVSSAALEVLMNRAILLADGRNYLQIPPPKSLDIRDYSFNFSEFEQLSLADGCATLNAFTAECIVAGLGWIKQRGMAVPPIWAVCGGGAKSPHLCAQIQQRVSVHVGHPIELHPADRFGWSAEGMEAELCAYLAVRTARGLPITFPGTTGVSAPLCGGEVLAV